MKIFYTSKLLREISRIRIHYPYVNYTPLTQRTSTSPPLGPSVGNSRYREQLPGSKNFVYESYSEQINDHEYATRIPTAPL